MTARVRRHGLFSFLFLTAASSVPRRHSEHGETHKLMRRADDADARLHVSDESAELRNSKALSLRRLRVAEGRGVYKTLNGTSPARQDVLLNACVPAFEGSESLVSSSTFSAQIQRGIASVKKKSVIFAGLLRDVGDSVGQLFGALHAVGSAFERYHIIIVENDSADGKTRLGLAQHCEAKHIWCFELEWPEVGPRVKGETKGVKRIQHMTMLRESLLQKVHQLVSATENPWDFLIHFDGDMFAEGSLGFNPAATLATFGLRPYGSEGPPLAEKPLDLVCSNAVTELDTPEPGRFRDTFALRKASWEEWNPWCCKNERFKGNELVHVLSCFSGMALYSMEAILKSGCHYTYVDEFVCEHVAFNRCLVESGHANIAIYPQWAVHMNESRKGNTRQSCSQWKSNFTV